MDITSTIPPNGETPQIRFSWIDYAIFAIMLGLSILIGIYHGYCGSKQQTASEYLLGGKTMRIFPISMSLIASYTSGIAILAVPADIYSFGATYIWLCVSILITFFMGVYVFLPVFLKLRGSSIYEYFQLRFDNRIRILASLMRTVAVFIYNPAVIYVPALAFSQVTGINLHMITPTISIICIFYTTVGGLKAVVWTDTLQTLSIALSLITVLVLGITSTGGFSNIWTKSIEGHRLGVLDFNIDPTRRDSVWTFIIGGSALLIGEIYINQGYWQRFKALPSIHHAKKASLIFSIGIIFVVTITCFTGLIIFSKYFNCDPLLAKHILRSDQLLPYYIMDVAGKIPGLPGLFIAGVISAGLSTLSTTLNSLAGTIYGDFIAPFMASNITQKKTSNIMKLIIIIAGAISTACVLVIEKLGGVIPLFVSIGGITSGPLIGLFCLGILFPISNTKGALVGGVGGLIFTLWMVIGNQVYKQMGLLEDFSKPLSIDGCDFYVNTTSRVDAVPPAPVFVLYRITFWYYSLLGAIMVIIIGLVVSCLTKNDDPPVHPDLISPVFQFLLSNESKAIHSVSRHPENAVSLLTYTTNKSDENT